MSGLARIAVAVVAAAASPPSLAQEFEIPAPLAAGHEALYGRLEAATEEGGETGDAAKAALEALRGHFEKEESYALPQLGALARLAGMPGHEGDRLTEAERQALMERTERFRAELPEMLEEHRQIEAALAELEAAARDEGKGEIAALAREIGSHARTEELVLYPAALLMGAHVAGAGAAE
jgi:hypothetical protein